MLRNMTTGFKPPSTTNDQSKRQVSIVDSSTDEMTKSLMDLLVGKTLLPF